MGTAFPMAIFVVVTTVATATAPTVVWPFAWVARNGLCAASPRRDFKPTDRRPLGALVYHYRSTSLSTAREAVTKGA